MRGEERHQLLFKAIIQGHKDTVPLLMEYDPDPYGDWDESPFLEAISKNRKDIVEELLG